MAQQTANNEFSLENVITTAIKIPGVKVNRNKFLAEEFAGKNLDINHIIDVGPVEAGLSKDELNQLAKKLILIRTSESSIASFAAGIPGGFAMAATIPADVLQFFGMTLRLAQELSYLYGVQDLWQNGQVNDEQIRSQLILYCGVMFGVTGASAGVRVLSTQLAKTTLKKLPQKALTKTFWYPLIKQIGKAIGVKVTKTTVSQGISKAIPVVGGVISGGLNFASMMPMAKRLHKTLEKSCFDYTEEELKADFIEIENISNSDLPEESIKEKVSNSMKGVGSKLSGALGKITAKANTSKNNIPETEDIYTSIEKLMKLKEIGAITEEEFTEKKKELLTRL